LSFRVSLVRVPLLSPFSNSSRTAHARNALVLQLAHGGLEALSECITDDAPSFTGEDNWTALRAIKRTFADELLAGPPTPANFLQAVGGVEGHAMAKAAVEMLLWDYSAKVAGTPLDVALGESRGQAEAGIALGLGRREEVRSRIEGAIERGYRRIKVKIEREKAVETLSGIRDAFPEVPLSADANGCFELPRDLSELRQIDRFGLQYLEQPLGFDDIADHSRLAKEISTPVCLDESITGLERAEEALDSGAATVINVKPGRVGGLAVALEIARSARSRGAHVWVGGMLETGVGRAFNVALASQRLVDYPGDTSPNDRYFEKDLVKNPFELKDGMVRPNPGPGIGVELDRDFLARVTRETWEIF
jgi:o-succinylbenzoate synthase